MRYTIKKCTIDDLITLCEFASKTFYDTFNDLNNPSTMKAYIQQAFNKEKIFNELSDINSDFYFLYLDKRLSGYLKLNEYEAQTDIHDPQSLEIERIYVTKNFQGKGLGNILINKAIDIAKSKGKIYVWLGVWEKNSKAIHFYKKNGFYEIGIHPFIMGEEKQTDLIMRKDLI